MQATIYHNTRCSKSRATLELLEKNQVSITIINYLDAPPTPTELKQILTMLGKTPAQLIRFGEQVAKDLNLNPNDERSEEEWIELMHTNPSLIERPIVVVGERAVVGRPPENVLALIS